MVVLWCSGVMVCSGAVVQLCNVGAVVQWYNCLQWCCGAVVLWCSCLMLVQWCCGVMVCSGAVVQWWSAITSLGCCPDSTRRQFPTDLLGCKEEGAGGRLRGGRRKLMGE